MSPIKSIARRRVLFIAVGAFNLIAASAAVAQSPAFSGNDVSSGGVYENYLRDLQIAGDVPLYPWTIRYLAPREIARIAPADSSRHPWVENLAFADDGARFHWIAPRTRIWYNSRSPYGYNDGVVWAGTGLTTSVQAGFSATFGPLFLRVSPIAFWAQNRDTPLVPLSGALGSDETRRFADPDSPTSIDLPQRFGEGAYSRIDPGESTLRIDLPGVGFGVSTALQQWGPGWDQPLIMSNNAPGFLHAFVGANQPINLYIGELYGRVVWGKLESSEYSPQGQEEHFMSGIVASFSPRGVDGLEIGGSRFFHSPLGGDWPTGRQVLKPFESFLKVGLPATEGSGDNSDRDNQLASAFARWTFPRSGFEFYGEFAREDHNWDLRDFLLEPDHDSAYTLGLAKVWKAGEGEMFVVRFESMNALTTHLNRVRPQTRFYRHGSMRTGHTNRGQILGAAAGYGGASNRLSVVRYDPSGSWTADLRRWVHREDVSRTAGQTRGDRADVSLELGRTVFLDDWELTTRVSAMKGWGGTGENRLNLSLNVGARLLLFSRDGR